MRNAVIFDGRNIYNPEQIRAHGFHLLLDGPAVTRACSSPAAPATSAATPSRRWSGPATGRRLRQSLGRPPRGGRGRRRRHAGRGRTSAIPSTCATTIARARDRRRDALRGLAVGRRLGAGSDRLLRNNVLGALSVLEAMVGRSVPQFVFSSTAAVFGNPDRDADHRGPSDAADQRLRRNEAGGRARAAALRARLRAAVGRRCAISTPRARIPTACSARTTIPELHVIPRAIDAAVGRGTFQVFGEDYETPDGTCLRDYVHVTDLAAAHVLALDALAAARRPPMYNLGNGRPTSVRDGPGRGGAGDRQAACRYTTGTAASRRSGGALRRRATASGASWDGSRASRTSTPSSKPPGGGARRTRPGIARRPTR